jgi:uncharacterized protein (DUF58 family)
MTNNSDQDIYVDMASLVRLRYTAQGFNYLPKQPMRSLLSGRKRSRLRGRGLDFDELRHYRPGDDIRSLDWRVTFRTGKPHVRVYTEERDRPVMVVVDQRLPMFFGSVQRMKSVVAAQIAAITAWRVLSAGDRVGSILFNDSRSVTMKPTRSEKKVMNYLGDLVTMNNDLTVTGEHESNPAALNNALRLLERSTSHDYLVILISDFYGWDEESLGIVRRIGLHNDVICTLIFDPLEQSIANARNLVVSDGRYQLEINPGERDVGEKYEANFNSALAQVKTDLNRHAIPIIPVDTVTPVADQLREKLGGQRVLR